jgi:C-terminal processing protease CtpA/Prc
MIAMKKTFLILTALLFVSLSFSACATANPPSPDATNVTVQTTPVNEQPPYEITGEFSYSNSIITDYYVEHAVGLIDMYGFVARDEEWEIPVASQTLGYLDIDMDNMQAAYTLQLPVMPTGQFVDVDNDSEKDTGVQVFAVSYWPNLTGGPYSEGDDRSRGWPTYLASVKTDTENNDEVIGGSLVVWAPDAKQQFPTGFGADGKLFTADDPVGPIPAGYSFVNLDTNPFTVSQEPRPKLELYEPKDVAIKDYSGDSYTEAFEKMFELIKLEYAFNGIEGKQPEWDKVYAEIKPRVVEAEKNMDPVALYLALQDYTYAFKDGHVGIDGGDIAGQIFSEATGGGFGFAQSELDDGSVIVTYVTPGGPAEKAGVQVGAVVEEFNGRPILEAIADVVPPTLPASMESSVRYQQARYLLRSPVGTEAAIKFTNPDGATLDTVLKSVPENDSHRFTSIYKGFDTNALPVEYKILDSGVGYVKINSNYDDLNLIIKLFERALKVFEANEVPGIIIDMRQNSGGANLGLAGFLTDQEIPMGQLEYFSEQSGKFEPEGLRDKVLPNENQYRFDKIVLLVGQACASACELEAYGFSQVPGTIVVGTTPSAGVEAEVARGQFVLPEGFSLQVPTGRFTLPDGSIFLEGQGVPLTLRVPVDKNFALSAEDEVLKAGERAVLQPLGAGVVPTGPADFAGGAGAQKAINQGARQLEELAREQYGMNELALPGTFSYTIALSESEPLLWAWGWCAASTEILNQNFENISLDFKLAEEGIPAEDFLELEYENSGQMCRVLVGALDNWPAGEHHLTTTVTFEKPINDGMADYPAGTQVFDYSVYVKP